MKSWRVLVTGGAGYIGSHTCVELLEAGYETVIYDNLSNSKRVVVEKIEAITGKSVQFVEGDIRERKKLGSILKGCDAVIHFAGLKAVAESVKSPLEYYDNNVAGTIALLDSMKEEGVKRIVFSSSATVYGEPESLPLEESSPLRPTNPYGRSKLMIEEILRDLYASDPRWAIMILRYFNPIGAHSSGEIGEDPEGVPNNLMPFVTQVAVGRREKLEIFGGDYDTKDGTGVRDYIHVTDLAKGHLKALEKLEKPICEAVNLGRGAGYSVLELIKAFERVSGVEIPYEITKRREGDVARIYADATKAGELLGWKAENALEEMCADSWRWQRKNPDGYTE